jgi:hypothetical protein
MAVDPRVIDAVTEALFANSAGAERLSRIA